MTVTCITFLCLLLNFYPKYRRKDVRYLAMEEENKEYRPYKDIGEISKKKGSNLYVKGFKQNIESRTEKQEIEAEYVESFKSVLESDKNKSGRMKLKSFYMEIPTYEKKQA